MKEFLDIPVPSLSAIGPQFAKKLGKLGLLTIKNLLYHFPSRYEDYRELVSIEDLVPGGQATVQGQIKTVNVRRAWRRRMILTEVVIEDSSGSVRAVWFHQPYLKSILKIGKWIGVAGKVSSDSKGLLFAHPSYEILNRPVRSEEYPAETSHTGRLIPVYPETKGITSRGIRYVIRPILKNLPELPDWIPQEILEKNNFPALNEAFRLIHFPDTHEEAARARSRFEFENLFLLQIMNLEQKYKLKREKARRMSYSIPEIKEILESLPFSLTVSQKKSLWEIIQDMAKDHPMNRLLQGDVGSGKTIVAVLSALIAAQNGYQTAFMAPTEILAIQHYSTISKVLGNIIAGRRLPVGLLTLAHAKIFYENGLEIELPKKKLKDKIRSGEIKIAIGTHALISEKTSLFDALGLVIIDEQHRFGVRQRARLAGQTSGTKILPHFLSMSATPIPRTLVLAIFGDLDLSIIAEIPAGRKPITTKAVSPQDRSRAYEFIRSQIKSGRQAFVVCPRIEKAGAVPLSKQELIQLQVKSVKEEYEKLSGKIFPELNIAMLHGKLKTEEKNRTMNEFREGKIQMLVSTSVIEVGVDVPNATMMMIEGAEHFGLAQLYQFRGRVGRGSSQSYCLLFSDDSTGATAKQRLKAIVEAKNGFELAEKDLTLRGPGQFLGKEQTGFPDTLMSGLQNIELLKSSRSAALSLVKSDPTLLKYPLLQERLADFRKSLHQE